MSTFTRSLAWLLLCAAFPLHGATVRMLNGDVIEGKVDPGVRGLVVTPLNGAPSGIDFSNVLEIVFRKPTISTAGLPAGVLMTNGTLVADRNPPALEELSTTFGLERIAVPTAAIAWILFDAATPAKIAAAPAGQTGGLMPNGDFFPGTLVSLRGGRVSLNSVLFGPQSFVPRAQVLGVCLREVKPAPTRFAVTTIHGSKFLSDDVHFDAAAVSLRDSLAGEIRLRSDDVASIAAGPGRVQAIAGQKPFRVDTHPGLPAAAAMHVLNPEEGNAILTTAANIAVTYNVPAGFSTFFTKVALPRDADPGVKAAFAVYADGHPLARTPLYSVADQPVLFRAELRGARVITLRVEPFGANTVVSGEWIAPLLLK